MELMETSLDIVYKLVYGKLGQAIPENILGVIALAVSTIHFSDVDCTVCSDFKM